MKFVKLCVDDDGKSYFEESSIQLINSKYGKVSHPINAENITFGEIENCEEINWHNTPCRQYIIMLQGSMEVEVSDGSKMIFNKGDILLAEDTSGQGHITRAASHETRRYIAIPTK